MESDKIPLKTYIQLKIIVRDAVKEALKIFQEEQEDKPSTSKEEFLSAVQAAQYLKVKLNSLYAKVERGELPYYRSGKRKLLFSKAELQDYIKNQRN